MKRPNPLQVKSGSMAVIRYSWTKMTAVALGIVAGIRLVAGLAEYELPISDGDLMALELVLVAFMGNFLRRSVE